MTTAIPLVFQRAPEVQRVTYVDADLYFFNPVQPVYDEIGAASLLRFHANAALMCLKNLVNNCKA